MTKKNWESLIHDTRLSASYTSCSAVNPARTILNSLQEVIKFDRTTSQPSLRHKSFRLKQLDDGVVGGLFGHFHDGTLVVQGIGIQTDSNPSVSSFLKNVPSEVELCGGFTTGDKVEEAQHCFSQSEGKVAFPLLLSCVKNELKAHFLLDGSISGVKYSTATNAQIASAFIYFRTKAEFVIDAETTQQGIKVALANFRQKVLSNDVAFLLPSNRLFLMGATSQKVSGVPGITADHKIKDLLDSEHDNKEYDILLAHMHLKGTKEQGKEYVQSIAPLLRHVRRSFETANIVVKIDVLSQVHRNAKVGSLCNVLSKSVLCGLRLVEESLSHQVSSDKQNISNPEMYHFLPVQSSLFISAMYPKSSSDANLKRQRELLHQSFGYALDQPLFRRSQSYKFPEERASGGPLTNPHEGLNSGVKEGQASVVKGLYSYHHYMQDRFDDNGWGCAYRSLQTIVSWFRLQGYTEINVPTHKQIQECLVKIGDKPSSFVGSRKWIGSTEVSFVLETMLGVTSKILTASTGEEVGSLGSELAYHFQTHGTPIMIGGGVLAHTIIGVDFNRSTGEIKFLILDPHYTGGEDIATITSKGWVGWKDNKFWTKNAFYNLCLPLRPIGDI
ncbi:ufm1-specific protease 2 isoform X2 [Thrips palmi]|uniref:Probable Ufm1-specific protease 2 n=1 Tax=Thrips palmi TaxID=161013 RepID=A0A6P8ZMQ0_THRPL|nr:ufm1-specific protease 2 isoform X2 [Thrips palmi]